MLKVDLINCELPIKDTSVNDLQSSSPYTQLNLRSRFLEQSSQRPIETNKPFALPKGESGIMNTLDGRFFAARRTGIEILQATD